MVWIIRPVCREVLQDVYYFFKFFALSTYTLNNSPLSSVVGC
jgi:hypothetical protein